MSFGVSTFGAGVFGAGEGGDASRRSPVTALLAGDLETIEHLLILEPFSKLLGQRVPQYVGSGWASGPGATLPTGEALPHRLFKEYLDRPPSREVHTLSNGEINQSAVPAYGEIVLSDVYKEFIRIWSGYVWDGAPVRHLQGAPEWPLSSFATTFKGEVTSLKADTHQATIQIRDLIGKLQRPIETAIYAGMGACLKGDGVDDRVTFGDVLDLSGSCTFRFRIWPNSNSNNFTRLWNKEDGSTGWLAYLNNQNLNWLVRGGPNAATTGNPVAAGRWNDCWLVYDAVAQKVRFHVLLDTTDVVATEEFSYSVSPTANAHSLAFGARSTGVSAYAGKWDELAIFNRAVPLEEIREWRSRPLTSGVSGLVGLWHCNEATGVTIYDSVSSNHGTITGALWDGSLTGTPSVAGKTRIGGCGILPEHEPVLLDEVNLVYEVAYGGYFGILQDAAGYLVKDRGGRVYTFAGDFAGPYDATPGAAQFITCKAAGYLRLGSKPQGKLTVWVQVTQQTDAASAIEIISARAGLQAGERNAGALAALRAKNSAPVSIPWGLEPVTADSLIVRAALAVGAWRITDLEGLLTVARLEAPSNPVADLTADDILEDGIQPVHTAAAARAVEIRYARYGTTQNPSELATGLTEREKADLGQEWRSYTTPETTVAVTADAAAPVAVLERSLVYETDARAEAVREAAIRAKPNRTDLVGLFRPRHDLQPGMMIRITAPVLDYAAGKVVEIVGKIIDDATESHGLEVWGPLVES